MNRLLPIVALALAFVLVFTIAQAREASTTDTHLAMTGPEGYPSSNPGPLEDFPEALRAESEWANFVHWLHDVNEQRQAARRASQQTVRTASVSTPVYYDGGTVWDRLAQCESGGNWATNTGNGYYGGLQFSYSTWLDAWALMSEEFRKQGKENPQPAGYAHHWSREVQIAVAERWLAATSWGQWPFCSRQLGLR